MMDQPIYLILGAGILIIIFALFLSKRTDRTDTIEQTMQMNLRQERAEMEKSLQRFVQQVKQESDLHAAHLRKTKENVRNDLDQLEHRIHTLEAELAAIRHQLATAPSPVQEAEQPVIAEEPEEQKEDTLYLRERFQRVFELQQEGLSLDEIAKQLGAGRGEIELILSLASPQERGNAHE
ncbi:MAG: DUF6115 domain-containing protein [Clostridia bacterium]